MTGILTMEKTRHAKHVIILAQLVILQVNLHVKVVVSLEPIDKVTINKSIN
jgi:hypothetical protein